MVSPLAKRVPVVGIKNKVGSPLAIPVPVDNTKNKLVNPLAKHVPVVLTALLVRQVVRILQQHVHLEPMSVVLRALAIHALNVGYPILQTP